MYFHHETTYLTPAAIKHLRAFRITICVDRAHALLHNGDTHKYRINSPTRLIAWCERNEVPWQYA